MKKIWTCKIGEVDDNRLPPGSDGPMRKAVQATYEQLTGVEPDFIFSGWGGELDEIERACVEKRAPRTECHVPGFWPTDAKFRFGEMVTTPRAPYWIGCVCGWYRNSEGRLGYNVESAAIPLAIHNYPETGLVKL